MTIDLTEIIIAIIALLMALAARYLIPYLEAKLGNERFENLKAVVVTAVKAAEMLYTEHGMGKEKKAYVMQYLNKKGYTVDLDTIDNLIESAVLDLNKKEAEG